MHKTACNTLQGTFDLSAQVAFIRVCWQGESVVRKRDGKWGFDTEEAMRELQAAFGGT